MHKTKTDEPLGFCHQVARGSPPSDSEPWLLDRDLNKTIDLAESFIKLDEEIYIIFEKSPKS
jgi:hypothetical protein